jgi:hypothetical protein
VSHLGEEFGLRQHGALGRLGRLAQLLLGDAVALDFLFEFGLRGDDIGIVERHHRHVDAGAEGRDQAEQDQQVEPDLLGKADQRVDAVEQREVGDDLHADDDARRPPGQIEEGEQRHGHQPGQDRRADAAILVAAPEDAEHQILDREQRQRHVPACEPQHQREGPEGGHGDKEHPP